MKNKKFLIIVAAGLILVILSGCFKKSTGSGAANLLFYGLDDSDVFEQIIAQYRQDHSNVQIRYKKFNDPAEFENLLVNEIAEGEGPDVFFLHNTWLPRHTKKLVPLVSETLTTKTFSETFVNVATEDFIQPDPNDGVKKIYALPLYADTLALYYNKEEFERKLPERGKPANTWELLKQDADKFRQQPEGGKLEKSLIALGRADNISLSSDILYNLFLQAGIDFYDADFKQTQFANKGQDVFDYFVSFAIPQNKNYSWDAELLPADRELKEVETFLSGKTAAMVGYSDFYQRLETDLKNVKSRNPSVISKDDVAVAPLPQMSTDESNFKVWANYYGLAVSRNAKNQKAAWEFVQYAASKNSAKTYHLRTKRPTARRDLIEDQKKEPITEVFASQLGYAGSFRIYSDQKFAAFLKEAVQSAANGQSSRSALGGAQSKINDLLKLEVPNGLYPKPKNKKK